MSCSRRLTLGGPPPSFSCLPAHMGHTTGLARLLPQGHLAGSIYGLILVTSVMATLEQDEERVGLMIAVLLVTTGVFALAHAWAHALDAAAKARMPVDRHLLVRGVRHEWPIVQAALPASIVLALAASDLYTVSTALWIATGVNVGLLFAWGVVLRDVAGGTRGQALLAGLSSAALGLLLALLKVIVSH
jgi:hypothetical protein